MGVVKTASPVVLLLHGGLGNQLFQYAAALTAAASLHTNSRDIPDPLVLSYGSEWGAEHPDLQSLAGVPVRYPNRWRRTTVPGVAVAESWRDGVSAAVARAVGALAGTHVDHQTDPYAPYDLPGARNYVLDGFYQHRDWWLPSWGQVAEAIRRREPAMVEPLRQEQRTVIKLRRSDYLGRGIVLTDDFYRQAFDRLDIHDETVTVICEDRDAAGAFQQILAEFNCEQRIPEPITGNANFDDFWHLAAARTQVMANSSYCWWAAAVAEVAETGASTRVAYPEPWLPNSWSAGSLPSMGLDGWTSIPAAFE